MGPNRPPSRLSRCGCSGSQSPFFYLPFEFQLKSGDMESTRGNYELLQLSMRQCRAAFGHRLRSSPSWGCGAGRGGEDEPGGGAWRAAARAPAHPAPATPGFLWDSQSAAETYPSVLPPQLGLEGATQEEFKQPRAPEGEKKKKAREDHAQRRLNRLSEFLYIYIYKELLSFIIFVK